MTQPNQPQLPLSATVGAAMSADLVAWYRAQLDEDERIARPLAERPWTWLADEVMVDMSEHIARHDPARVLREVEAKRRIIDLHRPGDFADCRGCGDPHPCATAKLLALPCADRPGYREEWRP